MLRHQKLLLYYKNKSAFKNIVFERETSPESDMLKEDNIKDLGN